MGRSRESAACAEGHHGRTDGRRAAPQRPGTRLSRRGVALAAALLAGSSVPARAQRALDTAIVITNVTVVDVDRGTLRPAQSVIIRGRRIEQVGATRSTTVRGPAITVDGRDGYLLPGLWDMHVHSAFPGIDASLFPLYIANGVTGVREMWGQRSSLDSATASLAAGSRPWPRVVGAGNLVDGTPPIWPGSQIARDSVTGRAMVDSLAAAGAGFIKVYSRLTPAAFRGIAARATERRIVFAGHVPNEVTVAEASDRGQRSIEHLTNMELACTGDEVAARTRRTQLAADTGAAAVVARQAFSDSLWASADLAACRGHWARFIRNRTWQVPTLTVLRNIAWLDDTTQLLDPRLRYIPVFLKAGWNIRTDFRFRSRTPAYWASAKRNFAVQRAMVGAMGRAGVPLLAGTDVTNPFCLPGFSLHDELQHFVEAGLTPLQALQTATRNPARYFAATDTLGAVRAGQVADLVLLDANPLADIANTRRIRSVVANGRLFRRTDLDALLATIEAKASGR